MKIAVKPDLKSKTFAAAKSYTLFKEKEIGLVNIKFYQKLFVVLILLSTFLIFPESPRELENICESYNSRKLCNVW
ncbi:transcription factor TFIID [Prochlorococcus marinus]|nr:transcription factor TFIID [Prochlorococcus marinus]